MTGGGQGFSQKKLESGVVWIVGESVAIVGERSADVARLHVPLTLRKPSIGERVDLLVIQAREKRGESDHHDERDDGKNKDQFARIYTRSALCQTGIRSCAHAETRKLQNTLEGFSAERSRCKNFRKILGKVGLSELVLQQIYGGERIDCCGFDHFSQVNVFVWSMRYGQQSRTVCVSRYALSRIEAGLQQPGTHFEVRRFARDSFHAVGKRLGRRFVIAARGGTALLQKLPFQRNPLLPALL